VISYTQGAYVGVTTGLILTLWVAIGAQVYKPSGRGTGVPVMNTAGCLLKNITDNSTDLFSVTTYQTTELPQSSVDNRSVGHPVYNVSQTLTCG